MSKVRPRGEEIRRFIVNKVEDHPTDVATLASKKFGISRQAINKHLRRLVAENALVPEGTTRARKYKLHPQVEWHQVFPLTRNLAEDIVWRDSVSPQLGAMPDNVVELWNYGFTEMFNNAIDHSDGSTISVHVERTAVSSEIAIFDDGVGIFRKIQRELGLLDERNAILELSKGKLTTDPKNHTGEGIFFSSRMFDKFQILSGGTLFSHDFGDPEDWILERAKRSSGTAVWMRLHNHTSRTVKKVFEKYSTDDDFGFTKTVVPVRLAQYGDDLLVSRSQAKRLLVRVDRFKTVLLDFSGVSAVGQAFADEIFRVFAGHHPNIELIPIRANSAIKRMIHRAQQAG
ncbi:STAS-like domain-containing protein [Immundisolibacter sp.]|uniref:STAS-like domain-containing protein n=1 Tax=Immundisolibacter sp. TaxID=1934948 RepID=UPI003565A237